MINEIYYHQCICDICNKIERKNPSQDLEIIEWNEVRLGKTKPLLHICKECSIKINEIIDNLKKEKNNI